MSELRRTIGFALCIAVLAMFVLAGAFYGLFRANQIQPAAPLALGSGAVGGATLTILLFTTTHIFGGNDAKRE